MPVRELMGGLTAQSAGLFLDLLKMELAQRPKLSLPAPGRVLEKVKIIVSRPAVNIIVATSNNLSGSLTFKTLDNLLPAYISSPWQPRGVVTTRLRLQ